jgi:hypothetical protein
MGRTLGFAFKLGVVMVLVAAFAGAAIGWLAPHGVHIDVDEASFAVPHVLHGAIAGSVAGLVALAALTVAFVILMVVLPLVLVAVAIAVAIAAGVVLGPLVVPIVALVALIAFLRRPAAPADKMPAN